LVAATHVGDTVAFDTVWHRMQQAMQRVGSGDLFQDGGQPRQQRTAAAATATAAAASTKTSGNSHSRRLARREELRATPEFKRAALQKEQTDRLSLHAEHWHSIVAAQVAVGDVVRALDTV
jgi:hypothetical protein